MAKITYEDAELDLCFNARYTLIRAGKHLKKYPRFREQYDHAASLLSNPNLATCTDAFIAGSSIDAAADMLDSLNSPVGILGTLRLAVRNELAHGKASQCPDGDRLRRNAVSALEEGLGAQDDGYYKIAGMKYIAALISVVRSGEQYELCGKSNNRRDIPPRLPYLVSRLR